MEEENFNTKLVKLAHDIEQLDAKIDDKISSLREELKKEILGAGLAYIRDTSLVDISLKQASSQVSKRVYGEIVKLSRECLETLDKISADEFEEELNKLKHDINRITRAAGLGEFWEV